MNTALKHQRAAMAFAAAALVCGLLTASGRSRAPASAVSASALEAYGERLDRLPRGAGRAASRSQPWLASLAESMGRSLWLRFLPWATEGSGTPVRHPIGDLWKAPVVDFGRMAPLLSDGQFVWGPNAQGFDPRAYLRLRQSPLEPYADDVSLWAIYTSVNPMVLLAVLELQQGWVSSLPPGIGEQQVRSTIESTAMTLATRFYEHLYLWGERRPALQPPPSSDPVLFFADGSAMALDRSLPSATYAVLSVLGQSLEATGFEAMVAPSAGAQTFRGIFGNMFPSADPLDLSNPITPLAAPPETLLQFPFPLGATWNASGPHSWSGGGYPPPFSSIDFFTGGSTCASPANVFAVAAAYGSAQRPDDYRCWLELDHGNGWVTSYYHLRNLYSGAPLGRNGKVGTIGCELCAGGYATGPHLHFSLKYNGAYVSLEGVKLSGWSVHVGETAYSSGSYEREGVFLDPYSQIINDYQAYYGQGWTSLRFYGNGTGDIDRVKVKMYDLSSGPPADIGNEDFTIEWWMKALPGENGAPALECGAGDGWRLGNILLDRDRGGQDRDYGVSLAGGRIAFGVGGDGTGEQTLCGVSDVADGAWHHIAVQRRRSDGWMWIFVDGALEAEVDGPDGEITYPNDAVPLDLCGGPCSSDPFLVIGAEKHGADPSLLSYSGWIDELRISRVLRYGGDFTPWVQPFTTDADTLVLLAFDDSPGTAAFDTSGYPAGPSNGTLKIGGSPAGPVWSTDIPFALPTPTPTATPDGSLTPTETPGPTGTPTPTDTPSPIATITPSPTATVTPSPTSTGTPMQSPSATPTASPTPSPSPTTTPTATVTHVPSATPAATATLSPTLTPTNTPAPSAAPSATITPSPTPTRAAPATTATPSSTPGMTPSPTPTVTVPAGSPTPTAATDAADLNQDGRVDVLDAQLCVNVFLGAEADPGIVARADVNGDGEVNVLDVQVVVNRYLGA